MTSQLLIDLGYRQNEYESSTISSEPILSNTAKVQHLSPLAVLPTLGSSHASGYDVTSTLATTLQPATVTKIPLDLSIEPPTGTYIHIAPRSGLVLQRITVYGGIIDADYRGNIAVLLFNSSNRPLDISIGQKIAQLIFKPYSTPTLEAVTQLSHTTQQDGGFGSTDHTVVQPTV